MEADLVVADRLAPRELLAELPSDTEIVDVAKLPRGRSTTQEQINQLIVEAALAGRRVARFKGGDSFVFGRGYEEVLACQEAGVPVSVIPGISSPFAVPAAAGIPVTHRGVNHDLTVVSGHLPPGHPDSLVQWGALARLRGTLVLMMAVDNAPMIAEVLLRGGREAGTPVAVVTEGTMPTERTVLTTLGELAGAIADQGVTAPGRDRDRRRGGGRTSRLLPATTALTMAAYVEISDPADPRLADYRDLRDVQLRESLEAEHGLFLAEGEKVVRRAVLAGFPVRSFLMAPRWLDGLADVMESTDAPCFVVPEEMAEQVTGFHVHRGALASLARTPLPTVDEVLDGASSVVVCEDIVDHTNVGAIFRSAAALGIDGAAAGADGAPTRSTGARSRWPWAPCSPCPGPACPTGTTHCPTSRTAASPRSR